MRKASEDEVRWKPRDERDYPDFGEQKLTVTITLMEYRELVRKSALWDEQEEAVDRLADLYPTDREWDGSATGDDGD